MKIFEERAKAARKHAGLNQSQAGRAIGISREAISQWENGGTKSVKSEHLHSAAEAYGVSAKWFASGEGDMIAVSQVRDVSAPTYISKKETVNVEHLSALAGMGNLVPIDLDHDSQITMVELTKQYIRANLGAISNPSNLFIVTAVGNSMQPEFYEGDTVFIDTGVNQFISEAVYFVSYNGDNYIKSVSRDGQGGYILISNNDTYPPINVDVKNDFRIIGKVAGLMSFKKI